MSLFDKKVQQQFAMYGLQLSIYTTDLRDNKPTKFTKWLGEIVAASMAMRDPMESRVFYRHEATLAEYLLDVDRVYFQRLQAPYSLTDVLSHLGDMLYCTEAFTTYKSRRDKLELLLSDD